MPELELCWGTVAGTGLEDLLSAAASAGFSAVTATPAMARAAGGSSGLVAALADDLGVRVSQLDPLIAPLPGVPEPGSVDESSRPLFEVGLEECLDLAEGVGAGSVNLAHFRGDPSTDPTELRDAVASVCQAAGARGLRVTVEFFPESALGDLGAAVALLGAVGAANLAIMVDTLHLVRSGGTADAVAALPDGSVGALQVADRGAVAPGAPYVPMAGRALPGAGILPLAPIVRAALSRGRLGMPAGLEVFDPDLRALGPVVAARRSAASLTALLGEVAIGGEAGGGPG